MIELVVEIHHLVTLPTGIYTRAKRQFEYDDRHVCVDIDGPKPAVKHL